MKHILFILVLISVTFVACCQQTAFADLPEIISSTGADQLTVVRGGSPFRESISTLFTVSDGRLTALESASADSLWEVIFTDTIRSNTTSYIVIDSSLIILDSLFAPNMREVQTAQILFRNPSTGEITWGDSAATTAGIQDWTNEDVTYRLTTTGSNASTFDIIGKLGTDSAYLQLNPYEGSDGPVAVLASGPDKFLSLSKNNGVFLEAGYTDFMKVGNDSAYFRWGSGLAGTFVDARAIPFGLRNNADYSATTTARSYLDSAQIAAMIAADIAGGTPIDTIAHMLVDTLQFVGGWGDGSDSTGSSDALYMGMFSVVQDSIVFDSVSVKCHGTGGDITVKWMYSVDWPIAGVQIHAEVNATHAGGWVGEDTFSPLALGLANYIWLERISGGGCQALRSILYYHEKRAL